MVSWLKPLHKNLIGSLNSHDSIQTAFELSAILSGSYYKRFHARGYLTISLDEAYDQNATITVSNSEPIIITGGASESNLEVQDGDITVGRRLTHHGDDNTHIHYTDDDIVVDVGAVQYFHLAEDDTQDRLNINEEKGDIDIRISSFVDYPSLFILGSTGNVGIGTTAATKLFTAGTSGAFTVDTTGDVVANSYSGTNVTSGANPGHTHTGTSLSGVDISDDTNLTCGTNCTLTGDDISVDDAFVINSGNDTMTGTLTADGLTLGANENITLGAQTLDHDGTDFVFNDTINASGLTLTTDLSVANGGTGASTLTDGGILLGSGTGAITALGVASNGQIPIGDGTTDPVLATITGDDAITITNSAGGIEVDVTPFTARADAASSTTGHPSGLEIVSNTLTLLQGCADNEILKWDEAQDDWNCEADGGGGGSGDVESVGDCTTGACFDGSQADNNSLTFEGDLVDAFEVEVTASNPIADVTVTIQGTAGNLYVNADSDPGSDHFEMWDDSLGRMAFFNPSDAFEVSGTVLKTREYVVRAHHSTTNTVNAATDHVICFDTDDNDDDAMHDQTTSCTEAAAGCDAQTCGKFTAPVAGWYLMCVTVNYTVAEDTNFLSIRENDTNIIAYLETDDAYTTLCAMHLAAANDYYEAEVYIGASSGTMAANAEYSPYFTMIRIAE